MNGLEFFPPMLTLFGMMIILALCAAAKRKPVELELYTISDGAVLLFASCGVER